MGQPVGALLRGITSQELTEWAAFEQENGSLGPAYERAMLREIHYMLQMINYTLGAVNTEQGKENPIPEPKYLPKPTDFAQEEEDEE